MTYTSLGFGTFRLRDFLPGEEYRASDGTLCRVYDVQPSHCIYLRVWVSVNTANAMKVLRHPTAQAFATSPEQARRVVQRVRQRQRRTNQKGDGSQ
jgi:hypothetical protein